MIDKEKHDDKISDLSAAILVGLSTRMGEDKALLKLDGQTFIGHLAMELSICSKVFISTALDRDYPDCDLTVIRDEKSGIGPMEGIRNSLRYADTDYVFICAVDMPFVCRDMVMYLKEFMSSDHDVCIFRDGDRIHPLCGIYSRKILPAVEEMIAEGRYRIRDLLLRVRTKYVDIEKSCFSQKVLCNVNTPSEYRALQRPAIFCISGLKNSGKTHLTERLIHAFAEKGLTVGVIKHDGHSFECDVEGTDSDRFYRAGASATAVFSPTQSFVRVRRQMTIDEIVGSMGDPDIIMIEGMKDSSYPKVEVIREEITDKSICDPCTLICIATDTELSVRPSCPVFDLNDTEGIAACIKDRFF